MMYDIPNIKSIKEIVWLFLLMEKQKLLLAVLPE